MQTELRSLTGYPKDHEDEDDDEDVESVIANLMPKNDIDALERAGVIILDREISKKTLAKASAKILTLHHDPNFNEDIQLILNSPGGETNAMWAFIDLIESVRLNVRTIAMGEICSAATEIFIAGNDRVMAPNAVAMIHHFSAWSYGNYYDLVAARKWQDMEAKKSINHYLKHSKYRTQKDIEKHILHKTDHWLTPQEMKRHGLCDAILKGRPKKKK